MKMCAKRNHSDYHDEEIFHREIRDIKRKQMMDHYIIRGILPPLNEDGKIEKLAEENWQDMERIRKINIRITKFNASLFINVTKMQSEKCLEEFIEISKCLSSLLPPVSDKSLFDVDDLLYGESVKQDHKSIVENKALYRQISAKIYISCCITFVKKGVKNICMDTALMQLMEHVPLTYHYWPYQYLSRSKNVYDTCTALKIVSVSVPRQILNYDFVSEGKVNEIILCMSYLRRFPEICSENGRRLSDFICRHASMVLQHLCGLQDHFVHGFDFLKACIVKMISERCFPAHDHIVSLIDTFINFNSSERDELANYLFKLLQGTDESVQEALKYIGHRHDANKPNNLPQKLMRIIFDHIMTNTVRLGEKLLKVEENMEFIDEVYGYKIEPYFPMNNEYKYRAFNKALMGNAAFGTNMRLIMKKVNTEKLSLENEDDIIFQKFLVYDKFMRNLHCMSIFHELFMELERRFKVEFPQSFIYSNFWSMVTTIGLVPWSVKMIVMKCPFLLKSSENKFIDMSFKNLTCNEKEFIDNQNWTNRMKDINPESYANRYHPKPSPSSLPVAQDYFVPGEKTYFEYLQEIHKQAMAANPGGKFICPKDIFSSL